MSGGEEKSVALGGGLQHGCLSLAFMMIGRTRRNCGEEGDRVGSVAGARLQQSKVSR